MPRTVVPLVTGHFYHIYNRGVDKRIVFNDKSDYLRFYRSLSCFNSIEPSIEFKRAATRKITASQKLVQVHAYCLLGNHYHLLLEQLIDGGISEFMKRIAAGYTGYYNEKNKRSGVLFQGQYKRVLIKNDEQYNYLFAYVNENYFVHSIEVPEEMYATSSFHYSGRFNSSILPRHCFEYDQKSAAKLARIIYSKRKDIKSEVFES